MRTLTEIHDSLKQSFIQEPLFISLYNLDITKTFDEQFSKLSIENILLYIVAVSAYTLEVLFTQQKSEIDAKLASLIPGTLRWYHAQCLNFQYGDALQWIDGKFQYPYVDETKRIVKLVAVTEVAGQLRIKVSKLVAGVPTMLTTQELNLFKTYINKIKFAGTNIAVVSYDAANLLINASFVYDPMLLTNTGVNISDSVEVLKNAINTYLNNIVYGGVLNKTKLIDAAQAVPGIVDFYLNSLEKKEGLETTWTVISLQNFTSQAGFYKLNNLILTGTADV